MGKQAYFKIIENSFTISTKHVMFKSCIPNKTKYYLLPNNLVFIFYFLPNKNVCSPP